MVSSQSNIVLVYYFKVYLSFYNLSLSSVTFSVVLALKWSQKSFVEDFKAARLDFAFFGIISECYNDFTSVCESC